MGHRRKGREMALQALYQMELTGDEPDKALYDLRQRYGDAGDIEPLNFCGDLVRTASRQLTQLDNLIQSAAQNWRMARMAVIDRNILRLGVAQLLHCRGQVPPKVAIDESIELAKRFGDDESGRFVNGILDRIYRESSPAGTTNKDQE